MNSSKRSWAGRARGIVAAAPLVPVPGTAALRLDPAPGGPALLVSDLHLGLGGNERMGHGAPEASAQAMSEALRAVARRERARRIAILGDVKHPIVGTPRPLRPVLFAFFSSLLAERISVDVVLGNHDAGLVPFLPREVGVHPASGWVLGGVGLFHGHRWPSAAVLRAPRLVAGHLHPGFRLAPSADDPLGKQRCWVRATLPPPPPSRRRRPAHDVRAREILILPAFNPIAGTEALNRRRPSPGRSFLFSRFLSLGEARAYLLDGTDLGPIPTGPSDRRPR